MNPVTFIPLFSAILTALIGFYVFLLNTKKSTNRVFSMLALFLAIFSISEFITRISAVKEEALFFGRICYIAVVLISCLGVHLSVVFPNKYPNDKNIFSKYKYLLAFLYVVGIIIAIFSNLLITIKDVKMSEWGYRVVLNPSTEFIIYWLCFCSFIATFSLVHTYFKKNIAINEKKQIQFMTTGFVLIVVFSLGTNLLPPLFDISVFPMTTVSLLLFSVMIAFSMIKYGLMKRTPAETADVVVDIMSDSLIVIDKNENIVNVNKSTVNLLGYRKEELKNSSLKQIVSLPEEAESDIKKVFESKLFGGVYTNKVSEDIEVNFVNKAGKNIPMSVSASPIYDKNKNLDGIVLISRNLSEIKKSIKEKELLLREIHHRVKNNLQTISSLLDLQSEQIKNKKISEMFEESQNRIKLMATLHEHLYQSKNLIEINFGDFIQNFITNLIYSYRINPDTINPKIIIEEISMDIDKTLICGFIINELVSNSLKHAFPAGREGEIIVEFRLKNNTYRMTVGDTGVGLPKEVNFRNTKTLGLQLVYLFVQQLKGNIKIDRTGGTKFIITFKNVKEGRRRKTYGKKADSSC